MRLQPDAGRQIELRRRTVCVAQPERMIEEVDLVDDPAARGRSGVVDDAGDRHMIGRGLDDHLRLIDRLAAPPQSNRPGISRARRHAFAMGARQQQRVGIEPIGAALGFRQRKSVRNETLGVEVEFPQGDGIAATARQPQNGARASRLRGDAAQQPVLAFACRELVDIQHDFPRRMRFAKLREGSLPPQAARVGGVLPEIVQFGAAAADIGNVVGTIVDRRENVAIAREGRSAERVECQAVLPRDEIERLLAFDLLQPEPGIVVRSAERRPVVDGHERNSGRSRRIGFDRAQAVKCAAHYHRPDCVRDMACARLRRLPALPRPAIVPGIKRALEST
ncbi:hypothetical protein ACVWZV_001281 [Bradyrhizobium sp. GM5.1]